MGLPARTPTPRHDALAFDRADLVYVRILLSITLFTFVLWAWVNLARTPLFFVEVLLLVATVWFAGWALRGLVPAKRGAVLPHVVLNLGILATVWFWIEPASTFPEFPIGYQFKDLHDGLILYLVEHGVPPVRGYFPGEGIDVPWIVTDRGGLWSAYPNAMHCLGAFLAEFGFPAIHGSLAAMMLACVATSYATYLTIKQLTGRSELAALFGGLVTLSTFRVPLAFAITPPQGFALALCFPVVWTLWFAEATGSWRRHAAAGLVAAALAAAYNGPIVLVLGGVGVVLAARLLLSRDRAWLASWGRSGVCVAAGLVLVAAGQGRIYWDNTFGELLGGTPVYDPTETAHFVLPFVRPIYLLVWLPAAYLFVKLGLHRKPLGSLVFGFVLLLSLTLPYDAMIHARNELHTWRDHLELEPGGLFGGAKHQKISRVALMQPFFFAAMFGALGLLLHRAWMRWAVGLATAVPLALLHFELPLYTTVEVLPYEFVKRDAGPVALELSDYVFCNPPDDWRADFQETVEWVDENTSPASAVAYLPGARFYNNRRVWMAVMLRRQVSTFEDLGFGPNHGPPGTRELDETKAAIVHRQGYATVVLDGPSDATVLAFEKSPLWELSHRQADDFVYERSRRLDSFETELAKLLWADPERGRIDLGSPESLLFLAEGWGPPHRLGERTFAKVMGRRASLYLPLDEPRDLRLTLKLRASEGCHAQRVTAALGDHVLSAHDVGADWTTVQLDVAAAQLGRGLNVLDLTFDQAVSPSVATDGRIRDYNQIAALVDDVVLETTRSSSNRLLEGFGTPSERWTITRGDWSFDDGTLVQNDAFCGNATILFDTLPGADYVVETRFRSLGPLMGAGFLHRADSSSDPRGAEVVQLVDKGRYLRWGRLEEGGRYVHEGGTPVGVDTTDGEWHVMRLEVFSEVSVFRLDGLHVATIEGRPEPGHVGLVVTGSRTAFDYMLLELDATPRLVSATRGL